MGLVALASRSWLIDVVAVVYVWCRLKTPEERERLLRLELLNVDVIEEFAAFVEEGIDYTTRCGTCHMGARCGAAGELGSGGVGHGV